MLAGWNADISDVHSVCATHLKDCCSDTSMVISDEDMFAGDSVTHLTERCLSTSYGHNLIRQCMSSTALALEIIFRLLLTYKTAVPVLEDTANYTTFRVDWDKLSVADKAAYVNNTDTILSSVRVDLGYLL